jgi:hypothetical protein
MQYANICMRTEKNVGTEITRRDEDVIPLSIGFFTGNPIVLICCFIL